MSHTILQLTRGTFAEVQLYTGPLAEAIFNTTHGSLHLQNGVTPGGSYEIGPLSLAADGLPLINGAADRGTSHHSARADHVHPVDTSRAPAVAGGYLPLSGGTVTGALIVNGGITNNGSLVQANNVGVFIKDTGGTARFVLGLQSDNNIWISDATGRTVNIQDTLKVAGAVQSTGANGGYIMFDRGTPANYYFVYGYGNAYRINSSLVGGDVFVLDSGGNTSQPGTADTKGYACKAGLAAGASSSYFNFNWTGALQAWIDSTNVGNITLTCDYRIKDNVTDLPSTWDAVKALRPISYTYKENPELLMTKADPQERWGFLAHELQEVLLPTAATGVKDEPNVVQSPDIMALLATVTRALQEAMLRVEQLEARA